MKKGSRQRFAFIFRSLVWSALLYMAIMLVFNWDEVNNTIRGRREMTIVTNLLSDPNGGNGTQRNIAVRSGIAATAVSVIKVITGLADHPAR